MYDPTLDGIDKSVRSVRYSEIKPPSGLATFVHCFWELKTVADLTEDFLYRALPDACVNLLLDQVNTNIAGVTALRTKAEVLNLGKSFHYVGMQFYPGVWQGNKDEIVDHYVGTPYLGRLPLISINEKITAMDFAHQCLILADSVQLLIDEGLVVGNPVCAIILAQLSEIHSVADMARLAQLSPRQLQRTLKRVTSFSPHDLLKVLRLQQSFRSHYLDLYADQSHYIHSFQQVTGYTPTKYKEKYRAKCSAKDRATFPPNQEPEGDV